MNLKNFFKKIKSYGFWVSLSSALVLLATSLGNAFGFEIENKIIEDVVMSVAGLLAVFGIVSMNKKSTSTKIETSETNLEAEDIEKDEEKKNK